MKKRNEEAMNGHERNVRGLEFVMTEITGPESLDAAVLRAVKLRRQHAVMIAKMEDAQAAAVKPFSEPMGNLLEAITETETAIHDYCAAYRDTLFMEKKSRENLWAVFGFKLMPWRVETSGRKIKWKDVIARLRRLRWGKAYVRNPEPQPDKEALLKDREKLSAVQKLAAGIQFAQEEQFFIRPKSEVAEASTQEAK